MWGPLLGLGTPRQISGQLRTGAAERGGLRVRLNSAQISGTRVRASRRFWKGTEKGVREQYSLTPSRPRSLRSSNAQRSCHGPPLQTACQALPEPSSTPLYLGRKFMLRTTCAKRATKEEALGNVCVPALFVSREAREASPRELPRGRRPTTDNV